MSTIKRFFLIAPIFLASFLFPVLSTFADTLPVFIKNINTSNAPTDVVKDASGNIYVLEKDANIIEKFDSNGELDMQWGGSSYVWPGILTIDPSDNIYIFDSDNIQILKFNSSGAYVTVFGSTFNGGDSFSSPSSIVADSLGNVYVGDSADSWGRIVKFDSAGNYDSQFPTVFNDDHLTYPSALAVDASDNIYVADGSRIVKFDSAGNYISEFGSSFTGSNGPGDSFSSVTGLAVASSTGDVYVSDSGNARVIRFDSTGTYVSEFGQDFNGGDFLSPGSLAVATSGDVYVLDNNLGRLVQFDSTGTYIAEFSGNTSAIYSFAVDSSGSVLVAEPDSKLIQKINPYASSPEFSNYIEHISLPGKFDTPQGIAIDSSSSYIYVTDTNNSRIQKFDTVGNLISVFPFSGVPNSIALDASGNMYVTDSNVGFQKLNSSGVSLSTWGGEYSQWFVGITLDASGNIYVADGAGPISKYSSTGTWIESIGGGFGYICGKLSVDTVGNIYVPRCYGTETAGEIFDSSGTSIATWPYGSADGQLQAPTGIFVDALKNIFISDSGNNRIAIFSYDIPEVSISSPADNTTFNVPHDPITLSANATSTVSAIESITFYDGDQQVGDPVVAAPYTTSWDISAATLGSHVIYAVVKNTSGLSATSSVTVNLADIVAPTVSLTSPSGGSSFSLPHDAIELTADASDEGGIDNVKFYLDTTLVGSPATTSPYAVTLRFPALTSGAHTLSAVAEDVSGNTATSTISITTSLSPAITILSPVGGSRINLPQDFVTVSATTSDALQDVRFYADGAMIGSTTLPPYSTAWDTSTLLEGTHTIDVVFRDTLGVPATSSVTVYAASSSVGFIRQIGISPFTSTDHVVFDPAGNMYVVDGANYQIEKFDSAGNFVTRFGANGTGDGEFSGITAMAIDRWSNIYVLDVNYYTSARVQKFDSSGNYLAQWGSIGTDDGQFMNPRGIAVDLIGNVFISDTDNHRIESFDSSGNFLSKFGVQGSGNNELNSPTSISLDASGNIYVNDLGNGVIKKFNSSGVYLSQWAKPLNIDGPTSAARDSLGNIYVSTGGFGGNSVVLKLSPSGKLLSQVGTTGSDDGQTGYVRYLAVDVNDNLYMIIQDTNNPRDYFIQKFDSSGNYLGRWGEYGSGDGQFQNPRGLAVDSQGNTYEADAQHFVQKFDSAGSFVAKYGSQGLGDGQFSNPTAIYVDAEDNIFVMDGGNYRVQKFDSDGNFLMKFGSQGTGPGQFGAYPSSITGDQFGNIYVGDNNNARIQKFDSSGNYLAQWGSVGTGDGQFGMSGFNLYIYGMFTSSSSVYAIDYYNNRIQRFDLSGNFLDKIGTSQSSDNGQLNSANDIFVDASGNVYVADTNNNRIQKFNSSGDYVKKWDLSYAPSGVSVDSLGNLYVTSSGVYVQKINDAGTVLRQWGGVTFNGPTHVAYDLSGNSYVVDSQNYRIVKFDIQGNVLAQWGAYGSGNGEFQSIHGIAVDPAGYVYIVDAGRIQKFNLSGTYLAEWTFDGNPEAITVDASGDVYVTDTTNGGYKKFDAQGNFISAAGQANVDLSTPGLFNNPSSVAVTASGTMYVLDVGNSRIQKFGSDRKYISSWGSGGSGQGEFSFNSDSSVVVDSSGNIYVSDTQNNRIQKFDSLGNFVAEWGGSVPSDSNGAFESPYSAALDSLGNIYVADAGNNRIQKFDSSGAYVSQFGSSGSGDGEFNYPASVAIDSLGNIYVVDSDNRRIQKFDSSGNYILQWGGTYGSNNGQFKNPQGIKIDANDNVYVADTNNNRIQKFDSSGNYLAQWGRSAASYNPVLQYPNGVNVDSSGNIYVANQAGNKIIKYASTTEFVFAFGSSGSGDGEFSNPADVAVDSLGNMYVADTSNNRVQKFDSSGNYITQWGGFGSSRGKFNDPASIVVDASDNVYVFDNGNYRIQKFDSSGVFISQIGKNEARVTNPNFGAIDSLGNLYVVSFDDKRVVKYDASGNLLLSWGGAGSGDGQFNNPQGIAVNTSDEVYVLDAGTNGGNSRVEKFDSNGNFVSTFTLPSTNYYGITIDTSGNIYAGNNDSLQVEKYDSTGNQVLTFSTNGSYVSGIIVDITGSIYISDSASSLIKKFDSAGTEVGSWGSDQLSSPAGLAINNGNLLVINANNFVATYDFSGSSTASLWGSGGSGDGQFSSPVGIAVNPVSHDVYVIDRYNNRIQKFDSGGNYLTQFGNPSSFGEISSNGSFPAYSVVLDSVGNIYTTTSNAITKYDSSGTFVASTTGLSNLQKIAVDTSDNLYVVVSGSIKKYDSSLNLVDEFAIEAFTNRGIAVDSLGNIYIAQHGPIGYIEIYDASGNFISHFGQYIPDPNDLSYPMDIAVDASGNSYVADSSNNRIQKFDSSGTYVSQFGTVGSADGEFNSPAGLAVDSVDNIYVADTGNNRIQKFDSSGSFITKWDLSYSPNAVSVDTSGNLYVTSRDNSQVYKIDAGNNLLFKIGAPQSFDNGQLNSPAGLAVDSVDNIYVADTGNNRIQKFDSSGTYVSQFGTVGSADGEFSEPLSVAVGNGNIYVADTNNARVQKFDSSGSYLSQFNASDGVQFSAPYNIVLDTTGNVYVSDDNYNVQKFDSTGAFISLVSDQGSEDGQVSNPRGLAFASSTLYVADAGNNRVQLFNSDDTFLANIGKLYPAATPFGIGVDSSGNVYVSDESVLNIKKYALDGTFLYAFGTSGSGDGEFANTHGLSIDSLGNIYVADTGNHRIQKFDSSGTYVSQFGTNGTEDGQFQSPEEVATDPFGRIFVADTGNNRVSLFQFETLDDNSVPTVLITSPVGGTSINLPHDPITVSADASDNIGVESVSFYVNGTLLGTAVTSAPYSISWNVGSSTAGSYLIDAVAKDFSGLTATSTISITVIAATSTATSTPPTTPPSSSGGGRSGGGGGGKTVIAASSTPLTGPAAVEALRVELKKALIDAIRQLILLLQEELLKKLAASISG